MPPRTSTKPFISITAQSSTESAQDAYMEGSVGLRGAGASGEGRALHSGLSNSTESIDSMKALTAAIEAANAQIHGPASQHVNSSSSAMAALSLAVGSSACTSASPSPALPSAIAAISIPALTMGPDEGPAITLASLPQLLPSSSEEARREALRKSRCLSIGIQVRALWVGKQGEGEVAGIQYGLIIPL